MGLILGWGTGVLNTGQGHAIERLANCGVPSFREGTLLKADRESPCDPVSGQPLDCDRITRLVSTIFAKDQHAKRVASLARPAVGALEGAALGIHVIGNALARAEGHKRRHAVRQVDRLFSNGKSTSGPCFPT